MMEPSMRYALWSLLVAALVSGGAVAVQNQQPPAKLTFPSKAGPVAFDHRAHVERERSDCAVCHDQIWPKSTAKPLPSSDGCKACHTAGGRAFEMPGNCQKCHATQ
jgi:c(7)-type cytochrome triheme protein